MAGPEGLDADCLLAARATLPGGPGDYVVIATTSDGHLARFPGVRAELWAAIVP